MMRIDYNLLKALHAVVSLQSFERAAQRLAVSQSAISQRIRHLEQLMGEPVLVRSQPPICTAIGQQLLSHYQQVQQLEQQLAQRLDVQQSCPILPLAVNADSLATWFLPALDPWLHSAQVQLQLYVENESQTWRRLISGEALGAVTTQPKAVNGASSESLGALTYLCVSSGEFQSRYFANGKPTKEQLKQAPAIAFDPHDDMHFNYIKQHFGLSAGDYPCHIVRSSEAFVAMACSGYAYCLVARQQIQPLLDNGVLINLLPELSLRVPLYWHCWQFSTHLMQSISESLITNARGCLDLV